MIHRSVRMANGQIGVVTATYDGVPFVTVSTETGDRFYVKISSLAEVDT